MQLLYLDLSSGLEWRNLVFLCASFKCRVFVFYLYSLHIPNASQATFNVDERSYFSSIFSGSPKSKSKPKLKQSGFS